MSEAPQIHLGTEEELERAFPGRFFIGFPVEFEDDEAEEQPAEDVVDRDDDVHDHRQ